MAYKFHKIRGEQGFTLMELLSVVLIIGILAVIAIPNVLSLSKRLQIAKLDEFARQIYLAAQNETMKMKASGRLNAFYIEVEEKHKADWNLEKIDRRPSDYPEGDTTWKLLYYIPFDDPMVQEYFLQAESSLNVATEKGGSFILELNPLTGDVYSVFYAERQDLKYHETGSLASRDRQDREAAKIGYYCGTAGNSAVVLPSRFEPKITFENGEELRVDITCPGMLRINGTQRNLNLLVTVTDESGDIWKKEYSGGSNELNIVGNTSEVSLLLDSAKDGSGFADITNNSLTPGDDITVKAEFTYTNGDIVINGQAEGSVNSLFAYRRNNGSNVEIGINCVRHLNNLREPKYVQAEKSAVEIVQMNAIDFTAAGVALTNFRPIVSKSLFESAAVTYNGGGNLLSGFVINSGSDPSGTGLFQSVENCTLKNIRMADCVVTGGRMTGAMVGSAKSAFITNCGVYLTTDDEYGRHNDMEERIQTYRVVGNDSVGGLIGDSITSTITNCFAAVSVNSMISSAGGLVGKQHGGEVRQSYSSGDVTATMNAGGLVGVCDGTVVAECYSTSDVSAGNGGGGLVGLAQGITVENSVSYGLVQAASGVPVSGDFGGFVGKSSDSVFTACGYLRQVKYNDEFAVDTAGAGARLYLDMRAESVNPVESSKPYNIYLIRNAFPFKQIPSPDGSGGIMTHYGDWPEELKLQTSLVYYEKYREENGTESFGYYAETSLTMSDGMGEQDASDVNTWKVDTLKDQYCVEDGYAVITPYALTSLEYQLNGSNKVSILTGAGADKANPMDSGVTLEFKRKEADGREMTYTVSNSYIFRLPFQLQMTDRETASQFYDELILTGYVETNKVFFDYQFYYCPDFAKNAINPSLTNKDQDLPADPNSKDHRYVYVRSPRQLNALGRNPYYWNMQKNTGSHNQDREFEFRQETDIDFGKYDKEYCGRPFNLMDTSKSNVYRNRPIGRPNESYNQVQNNFRYVYDGGGHKIIDYCCSSDENQFVGLFGEVQHGVLKNILMTASAPELEGGSSAYVESSFKNSGFRPGVGALVGLLFVAPNENYKKEVAVVENCSVSGYRVTYAANKAPQAISLGGLVGYSFGYVRDSSAVNKLIELRVENGENYKMLMGGVIGGVGGQGTVEHCYAGGNLRFQCGSIGSGSAVSGIGGGTNTMPGHKFEDSIVHISNSYSYCTWDKSEIGGIPNLTMYGTVSTQLKTENCYYLDDTRDAEITLKDSEQCKKSLKELSYLGSSEISGFGRASDDTSFPWPEDEDELSGRAFPFPAVVQMVGEDGGLSGYVHYGSWPSTGVKGEKAYLCYYEKYEDGSFGYYYINEDGVVWRDLDDTDSKNIADSGYGVLCSPQKNFEILYEASWDQKLSQDYKTTGATALAGKLTEEGEYNLYAFDLDFKKKYLDTFQGTQPARGIGINYIDNNGLTVSQTLYINTKFGADIALQRRSAGYPRPAEIRTAGQLQELNSSTFGKDWIFEQTHDIIAEETTGLLNNNSGGYCYDGKDHEIKGLKQPLFAVSAGSLYNIRIVGADISAKGNAAALVINANFGEADIKNCMASGSVESLYGSAAGLVSVSGGNIMESYTIINVTAAGDAAGFVAEQNSGTIQNCYADTTASGRNAAGFIYNLKGGSVLSCRSKGSVTANGGNAGGFGGTLFSGVDSCYSNCQVAGSDAAGFAYWANGGKITNCYSVGSVTAGKMACGFLCYGWATVSDSYSVTEVKEGSTKYGFSGNQINNMENSRYYWVSSTDFNKDIDDKSNAIKLGGFKPLSDGTVLQQLGANWTLDNQLATVPDTMSGAYPYPRLKALAHYGDWPVGTDWSSTIGVFQVYRPEKLQPDSRIIIGVSLNTGDTEGKPYGDMELVNPLERDVYGVFFSKDMDLSKWKVAYHYDPGHSNNLKEEVISLQNPDNGQFYNLSPSLTAYTFAPSNGVYQLVDIVITGSGENGKSYTFRHLESGKFAYEKP